MRGVTALDVPLERMTLHGFRTMARTILDEVLGFRPNFIEHQLAHAVRDPNGRVYNRTAFLPERTVMMRAWADYLDRLRAGEGSSTGLTDRSFPAFLGPEHRFRASALPAAEAAPPTGGIGRPPVSLCHVCTTRPRMKNLIVAGQP